MASRTERSRPVDLPDTILTVPRRLPGRGPLLCWGANRSQLPEEGTSEVCRGDSWLLEGFDLTQSYCDAAELGRVFAEHSGPVCGRAGGRDAGTGPDGAAAAGDR